MLGYLIGRIDRCANRRAGLMPIFGRIAMSVSLHHATMLWAQSVPYRSHRAIRKPVRRRMAWVSWLHDRSGGSGVQAGHWRLVGRLCVNPKSDCRGTPGYSNSPQAGFSEFARAKLGVQHRARKSRGSHFAPQCIPPSAPRLGRRPSRPVSAPCLHPTAPQRPPCRPAAAQPPEPLRRPIAHTPPSMGTADRQRSTVAPPSAPPDRRLAARSLTRLHPHTLCLRSAPAAAPPRLAARLLSLGRPIAVPTSVSSTTGGGTPPTIRPITAPPAKRPWPARRCPSSRRMLPPSGRRCRSAARAHLVRPGFRSAVVMPGRIETCGWSLGRWVGLRVGR